jgi:type VI secretion system secreted protein VgrG
MPATYVTENRYLYLKSPLPEGDLLLSAFSGEESISELFSFQLDLLAENSTMIAFDKLLGQKVGFGIAQGDRYDERPFHGICTRVVQLSRDKLFTRYRVGIVPGVWLLTQRVRSRIFQKKTIPDILKTVFEGFDAAYLLQGKYEPRDYCVQYQESDFNFASRLMEEEGIFYFFKFTEENHQLVLADNPQAHVDVPGDPKLYYEELEGGLREEERIDSWEKSQDLRSGKYTVWDHNFGVPTKNLEAEQTVIDSVTVGKVTHKLKVAGNEKLEIFDWPGGYASRFDATGPGKIFEDNKRTVGIRMQQVETPMLLIRAGSNYRHIIPGYRFTLQRHFNGDGQYVIVSVHHEAYEGAFRSEEDAADHYVNLFTCIPVALPFRPQRKTARPVIHGCQTAMVTGPPGEEIYTDQFGRVKVLFRWDREGKSDDTSSCWIRVATTWAGKRWGAISLPRMGQEVIVDFIDGDPDRPIITGSGYNADQMPSYALPDHKTRSGVKTLSSKGGGGFNEIRFEDKKDNEQIFVNGQKDLDVNIGNDRRETIGRDRHLIVKRDRTEQVDRDYGILTKRDYIHNIGRDVHEDVSGKAAHHVGASYSLAVDGDAALKFGGNVSQSVGSNLSVKAGTNIVLDAGVGLTIKGPGGHITIDASGVTIVGTLVKINSGGSPFSASSPTIVSPLKAAEALLADTSVPGGMSYKTQIAGMSPALLAILTGANAITHDEDSEDNKKKTHWVEIALENPDGTPAAGAAYQITLPDGSVASGSLDEKGLARVEGIDPGQVQITFTELDKEAWEPK